MADEKDYETFAAKYPMDELLKEQNTKIEEMAEWTRQLNITATPTFFVNGYQLPEIYSVTDLKYFLSA